jgi:hypothetical protein
MSDMSKRFPYINDDCEEFWNTKLPSVKKIKELANESKLNLEFKNKNVIEIKELDKLILGQFCIRPGCMKCVNGPGIQKCVHGRCDILIGQFYNLYYRARGISQL